MDSASFRIWLVSWWIAFSVYNNISEWLSNEQSDSIYLTNAQHFAMAGFPSYVTS